MKKPYLTELLENEYRNWRYQKILIKAPTGLGKSTFILKELLPYLQGKGKRLLILCNRRLLRLQYWYQVVHEFDTYHELCESVDIVTYQEMALRLKENGGELNLFTGYDVICLDECHYFYSDSDFNGFGTYALLQAIILSGITKQMIFLSATAECVETVIDELLKNAFCVLKTKYPDPEDEIYPEWEPELLIRRKEYQKLIFCADSRYKELKIYDFMYFANYDYLKCMLVPDLETICIKLLKTDKKSIVFIDDKKRAGEMAAMLISRGKLKEREVVVLNAENLDDGANDEFIKTLALVGKLDTKILITTSVLDNGVSIHDHEVENLVIMTESKVSFMQMLGRVRNESIEYLNLMLLKHDAAFYERRERSLAELIELAKQIRSRNIDKNRYHLLQEVWDGRDERVSNNIRKLVTITPMSCACMKELFGGNLLFDFGDAVFSVNELAERKIEDLYLLICKFHILARMDEKAVAEYQLEWLGKDSHELEVMESTYLETRKDEFINSLLKIQNFNRDDFIKAKQALAKEYRREFFEKDVRGNSSFSTEKLEMILTRYNLMLVIKESPDGRKRYTVERKK